MIKIENLVHKYTIWKDENTKSEKTVLDGISLDIPSGQFVAILGPNGSGKSTLAKHLNVLLLPNEGTVWIDGKDTHAKERLWEIRKSPPGSLACSILYMPFAGLMLSIIR